MLSYHVYQERPPIDSSTLSEALSIRQVNTYDTFFDLRSCKLTRSSITSEYSTRNHHQYWLVIKPFTAMTWTIYDEWFAGLNWAIDADDDPAGPPERVALFSYLSGTTTTNEAAHVWAEEFRPGNRWGSFLIDIIEEFPQDHGKVLELLDAIAQLLTTRGEFEEGFRYSEWDLQMAFNGKSNVFVS